MEDALRFCTVDYVNQFAFVARQLKTGRNTSSPSDATPVCRQNRKPRKSLYYPGFLSGKRHRHQVYRMAGDRGPKNDIDTFEAFVLPENHEMLAVFQGYGFHMKQLLENNVYHITFP